MLHQIFEQHAGLNPQSTAIDAAGGKISYGRLAQKVDELAALLRAHGVEKDTIVATTLPLSADLMVSMLAIFKAHGIYLPVDLVKFSPRRLNQVFTESFHRYLIVEEAQVETVNDLLHQAGVRECLLFVPREDAPYQVRQYHSEAGYVQEIVTPVNGHVSYQISGVDSCYIYYTSGSTGEGKAILGCHASLEHYILWAIKEFKIGPADKVAHLSQTTFDASLKDSLMALCSGATLVSPPPGTKENMSSLCRWVDKTQITIFQTVPSLFRLMIRSLSNEPNSRPFFKALRIIFLDGEPLLAKDVLEWRKYANPQTELVNMYGTTETTILDTCHRITTVPEDPGQVIHVGKPIDKTFIMILNQRNQLCRIGEVGEVYIKSAYLTKGYYKNEALTREVFVQNPLITDRRDTVYKTGDLGRYLPDRSVEILGRKDRQLKINGIRVELGEIEKAVLRTGLADEVVVKDIKNQNQQTHLICYYTTSAKVSPAELRNALRQELNQNLLPSFFIPLEQLPININGKVDKNALPLPPDIIDAINYEPVQGVAEEQLERIWKHILEVETIGRKVSFFDLGGHSLKVMQLITRVQQDLGVGLKMQDVFAHSTIEELAAYIGRSEAVSYLPISQAESREYYPLSFSQQRLWFIHSLEGAAYNIPATVRIRGAVNVALFNEALGILANRHENLRTSFPLVESKPVQKIEESISHRVRLLKLGRKYPENELHEIIRQEIREPFDLDRPPLMRLTLIEQDGEYVLILVMHHIITDHWSMNILTREFFTIYDSLSNGLTPHLPPLPIRYTDFVGWQRAQFESAAWEPQFHYWKEQLEGMPALLQLPFKQHRPKIQTYNGSMYRFNLNADLTEKLRKFCREEECTLFMALMTAFAILLNRYSGQTELVIGYPVANRHRKELEPLVGFFANTLVMCLSMKQVDSFSQLLQQIKQKTVEAYDNQDYPFEKLVENLNPKRTLSYSPLFQVMLSVQQDSLGEIILPGMALTPLEETQTAGAKFDLNLIVEESGGQLSMGFEFNTDLFDAVIIGNMIDDLPIIIEDMVAQPEQRVNSSPLLIAKKAQIIAKWNETGQAFHTSRCVHHLFEEQAALRPQAIALDFQGHRLSYAELNCQANQLARHLLHLGLAPEDIVGICMERSVELVVAILAVLKAGGAYLPLEPSLPPRRLAYMIEDAGVDLVLVHQGYGTKLPETVRQIDLSAGGWQAQTADDLCLEQPLESLAYVLYTSGSTGQPKGVMTEHKGLLNRLLWNQESIELTPEDRVLQMTPFSFDISACEFLWPLMTGARLVVAVPEGHKDPHYLLEVIEREGITTIHFVPSMLEQFLAEAPAGSCAGLRRVICGGEAMSKTLHDRFFERMRCELYNLYGPTEAAIDVTWWRCQRDWAEEYVPIGRPISNMQVYILDEHLNPVPEGVTGELHLAGVGLARGYINNPGLTAEKFINNPFREGTKLYKTGDLGRYTSEGIIQYIGRTDNQVKLRGHRIELGEVEHVLLTYLGMQSVAVLLKSSTSGQEYLAAYYTTEEKLSVPTKELRSFALEMMPEYMVPSIYVFVEEWPLTTNGKTDRASLKEMEIKPVSLHSSPCAAPQTPTEIELAKLWRSLLPVENLGIDDDFFDLGGHSLMAMELLSKIQERFNLKLQVTQFFEQNTIRQIAFTIDKLLALRSEIEGNVYEEEEGDGVITI